MYTRTQNEPYPFRQGPSRINIYHTRGRTLLSQVQHTNESILCHEPSPRTIIVTCPSCTVDPTDPERSRTPTAEVHHSGTMTPRHRIGKPRCETPDLRRPVSITAVSQTAITSTLHILLNEKTPAARWRISSKLIFASCVGYFDRAYYGFYVTSRVLALVEGDKI